jgi:hypothetical protein
LNCGIWNNAEAVDGSAATFTVAVAAKLGVTVVINAVIGRIVGATVSCCVGSANNAETYITPGLIVGPNPAVLAGCWNVEFEADIASTPIDWYKPNI